jgi:hypothetical protein
MALAWSLIAASPNVAIVPAEAADRGTDVLSVGVFGDRYLYYSSAGAGLLLVASLDWLLCWLPPHLPPKNTFWRWLPVGGLVVILLAANTLRIYAHEKEWDAAGRYGQALVEQAWQGLGNRAGTLCLVDLPDSYRGKYVFRNGIEGALWLARPGTNLVVKLLTNVEPFSPPSYCTYVLIPLPEVAE